MEAKTRKRGVAALPPAASQIPMFLSDTGVGKATRGPGKPSLALDEIERLALGKGREGAFASSVRPKERTSASPRTVLIHVIFSDTNIQVYLHKKYYLSIG